jgi:hypothetical protein
MALAVLALWRLIEKVQSSNEKYLQIFYIIFE